MSDLRPRTRPWYLKRRSVGDFVFDIFNGLFLIAFAISILYPFWTQVVLSFSDMGSATTLGFRLWMDEFSFAAYEFAFRGYGNVGVAYANSVFRAVVGTTLTVLFTIFAAYPLSQRRLPGRTFLTIVILITMFFSGGIIPEYLLIRYLGLIDSRWALILPTLTMGFYIIIMRNFMMTIDKAYEESAFVEGSNYVQVLFRIIIPLSKPVIATIVLWTAVYHWNEWFHALIYINSDSKVVLQLLLRRMMRDIQITMSEQFMDFEMVAGVQLPTVAVQAAVTIMTIGPIILVYPFIQRHFIKGIFIGSLKG